ncbi:MAG TPA: Hpt domain-containing protein [Candidatus Thermoplasmatota archaeon]|nr:Hpt domain-containing protein [Candidatus Thermoplasmatota archaeon]
MGAVDPAVLEKLHVDLGSDPAVTKDLIETLLGEAPRILEEMRASLATKDRRTFNRGAHSLKSTSGTFGANALSQLCRDLERESEKEMPPHAEARYAALAREWQLVAAELAAWKPPPP